MNTFITKTVPAGNFEEIGIGMPEWKIKFLGLVEQRKHIKCEVYTMPTIAKEIKVELGKKRYSDFIFDQDHDQHFLVPKSN